MQNNLTIRFLIFFFFFTFKGNFKLIFLVMRFLSVATMFSLALVICLSWYLHHKLSHDLLTLGYHCHYDLTFGSHQYKFTSGAIYLTLWNLNGVSKSLKDQSIRTLSTSKKLAVIWTVLKCYYVIDLILDSVSIVLFFYCKFWAFRSTLVCIS